MRSLQLNNFSLTLGSRAIFRDVDALIEWPDERSPVVAVMGPSGSGKTSLAQAIVGHRYLGGFPGIGLSPEDLVLAYMPQVPILFPHLDALSNARLFRSSGRYTDRFDGSLFSELAETLRLSPLLQRDQKVEALSGGEAQRLMLLRTLSIRPDLLILDEPCTGLDTSVREAFLVDLLNVTERFGVSVLYVSHHWSEVAAIAGKVAYLRVPPNDPDDVVRTVIVKSAKEFRNAPPTVEAFEAVYGLGTSVWPVIQQGDSFRLATAEEASHPGQFLACFPPRMVDAGPHVFTQAGPHRLSSGIERSSGSNGCRAWIYRDKDLEATSVNVGGTVHVG